jgi:hypothetical protein
MSTPNVVEICCVRARRATPVAPASSASVTTSMVSEPSRELDAPAAVTQVLSSEPAQRPCAGSGANTTIFGVRTLGSAVNPGTSASVGPPGKEFL